MSLHSPGLYRQAIQFTPSGPAVRQSPAQSALQRAIDEAADTVDLRNCRLEKDAIVGPEEDVVVVSKRLENYQTDYGLQIKLVGMPERVTVQ